MGIRFTWDLVKETANRRKHGVPFHEAPTVFADPLARIHNDPRHSQGERREIIIGHSTSGRLILVSFTERRGAIRIISARRANSNERKDYEEGTRT